MTTAEEERIRELPKLIANSKDPETVKAFAAELVRLLTLARKARELADQKPRSR